MSIRRTTLVALTVAVTVFGAGELLAHPGSGIVVDQQGNVYFTHTGRGAAKIDLSGRLSIIYENAGGHWMGLDRTGAFADTQPEYFRRVTPNGAKPAVIYADGGAPLAVGFDGYLYYGAGFPGGSDTAPGGASVARFKRGQRPEVFAHAVKEALARIDEGVTGLAVAPDDSLLIASASSIWRLKKNGGLVEIARPVTVPDCDEYRNPAGPQPQLRGLAAAGDGTILAAATGCRCVVKIDSEGQVEVVLKSVSPWTPTGVALRGEELYVLEYTHANDGADKGWRPRVRCVTQDGQVRTLFEAQENIPVRR